MQKAQSRFTTDDLRGIQGYFHAGQIRMVKCVERIQNLFPNFSVEVTVQKGFKPVFPPFHIHHGISISITSPDQRDKSLRLFMSNGYVAVLFLHETNNPTHHLAICTYNSIEFDKYLVEQMVLFFETGSNEEPSGFMTSLNVRKFNGDGHNASPEWFDFFKNIYPNSD